MIVMSIHSKFQTVLKIQILQNLYNTMSQFMPGPQNPHDLKLQNLTREELKKIQKSMKQPEFLGLLNEYMIEISDPKNRQQYDEYLRQMQRQGELPKNMRLVELTPHFCIRTNIVSEKNKKHNMKFFINFCSTQFLQQPICESSLNEEGKSAFGWKVPNSMGKIRYDQDKQGNPCQVADVAFNHKAFEIVEAQNNLPFRKNQFKSMLIAIGLQCAQKQLGERKQTLSKDYDILKNLKCKGGKPALLPLRYIQGKAYNKGQGPEEKTIQRDTQGRETKLQKQINGLKQKADNEKLKEQKAKDDQMQEDLDDKKVLIQDLQEGIQQPKYSSIYTHPVDYSQFLEDPSYAKTKKVPSHFTVEFKLPRVQGMEEIGGDSLNINENRIILKVGEKYFIDLPFETFKLKYKLIHDKIKAKFDKKKKVLRITFPVDQTIKYHEDEKQTSTETAPQGTQQINDGNQVLQNEVWKNKVLEVSEPSVDLKIIEDKNENKEIVEESAKKLIEEIDQDDIIEEQNNAHELVQKQKAPQNFEEALEQQKSSAFSLRKYYPKKQQIPQQPVKPSSQLNYLSHVFQQTNDKVVLVIKMLNYKKQQLQVTYDELENNAFYVQWNQNKSQTEQNLKLIHVLNLTINEGLAKDIKKVQIVQRVNFLAIFLHKTTANKFWQKQSVTQIHEDYQTFKQKRDELEKVNKERAEAFQRLKEQQKQARQAVKPVQSAEQSKNIPTLKIQRENLTEVDKKIYSVDNETLQQPSKLQGEYFNFNNLPPQFIQFDIKFIEDMD